MTLDLQKHTGLVLSDEQTSLLNAHLDYVLAANERVQLTSIRSREEGERLHLLDSLMAVPEVNEAPAGRLLDMGTGGGFPGIPLCVVTGRETVLLDSVKKKMRIMDEFIATHPVNGLLSTRDIRAEELAVVEPAGYSVITARALSSLPSLVELASPLLKQGGRLVALKGPVEEEELKRGDSVASYVGMQRVSVRRYDLPPCGEQRSVVVYIKNGKARTKLPRRPGMAQRKPFA